MRRSKRDEQQRKRLAEALAPSVEEIRAEKRRERRAIYLHIRKECEVCHQQVPVRKDGSLWAHGKERYQDYSDGYCPGSRQLKRVPEIQHEQLMGFREFLESLSG